MNRKWYGAIEPQESPLTTHFLTSEAPPCKGATIFLNRTTNWGPTVQTREPLCSKPLSVTFKAPRN